MVNPWHLKRARRVLRQGGVIAYPTEAVYGLGCDPWDAKGVFGLTNLKRRSAGQGFILIASELSQVRELVKFPDGEMAERVIASWPGHTTWIFDAGKEAPPWLVGDAGTLALRVTSHPLAKSLCQSFGRPIISTSANMHGRTPARTALQVRTSLPRAAVDYILCGEVGGRRTPSEIRDARNGKVIRKG